MNHMRLILNLTRPWLTTNTLHNQIETYETPGAEYVNKNNSEDTEANKTSAIANFMCKILPDDNITEGISSLNSKQREVFNVVHTCAKDFVKYNG